MTQQFGVPDETIRKIISGACEPSSLSPYLAPIHHKHVIGINNAYLLGNWLDVVFFGDCAWYLVHREGLAKWPNLKVTCCDRFANRPLWQMEGIKYLAKDNRHPKGITREKQKISWNNNSGAAAINLAYLLGVQRIILLGFDMNLGKRGETHWHRGHNNKKAPPFSRHLRGFPLIAREARDLGLEILNASPNSDIEVFPKVELKDIL